MAAKTYRKTALVTAEQFLPEIGQIPAGIYSTGLGDPRKRPDCDWVLDTREGRHVVRGGDYICTGPAGERWNVAAEIFEATYEEVEAPAPQAQVMGIVPPHCSGYSFGFEPGVLHVKKDGSGHIVVNEEDFILEDDRTEGPDGPEGSVHWIVRLDASEIVALRDFLNGATSPEKPE